MQLNSSPPHFKVSSAITGRAPCLIRDQAMKAMPRTIMCNLMNALGLQMERDRKWTHFPGIRSQAASLQHMRVGLTPPHMSRN